MVSGSMELMSSCQLLGVANPWIGVSGQKETDQDLVVI